MEYVKVISVKSKVEQKRARLREYTSWIHGNFVEISPPLDKTPQFDEEESLIEIVLRQLRCSSVHFARFASLIYMYGCPLFFHLSFYDDGSFDTTISSKRKLEADVK